MKASTDQHTEMDYPLLLQRRPWRMTEERPLPFPKEFRERQRTKMGEERHSGGLHVDGTVRGLSRYRSPDLKMVNDRPGETLTPFQDRTWSTWWYPDSLSRPYIVHLVRP